MAKKIIIILGFLIPFFFIYSNFFSNLPLVAGDAPFFYPENLRELFNKPLMWDVRNDNLGASQSSVLWLYLPTFIMGLLHQLLGWQHQILVRLVFYFPATMLSIVGCYLLIKRFTKDSISCFLGSFLYSFNTYLLLLIDGGQLGVALAYGIFPWVMITFLDYLERPSIKSFVLSLSAFLIICNVDIRIAVLAVLLIILIKFVLQEWKFKWLINLFFVIGTSLLINSFWLLPLLSGGSVHGLMSSGLSLVSLIDTLLLFQPHFPLNEFGKTFQPPFYFALLPLALIPIFIWIKDYKKNLLLILILLIFLAKGGSEPFGWGYDFLVNKLPFGYSLRDSSKFYIPLILIFAVLLSLSVQTLKQKINKKLFIIFSICLYLYLLLLIHPAVMGHLTGVLSKEKNIDYQTLYQLLSKEDGFYRTLWFPQRSALAYGDWQRPALSAEKLFENRPFASMIEGDYDLFYFLHNPQINQWFDLLGIKYLFFPEDPRKKSWTVKEREERRLFVSFVNNTFKNFEAQLPVSFPNFKLNEVAPHLFGQKRAFLVVGGDEIYDYLLLKNNFSLNKNGFLFLEDKVIDLNNFPNVSSASAILIFNHKANNDLLMSYFKGLMVPISSFSKNEWAVRDSSQYLKYKDELSQNGIKFKEYDFGKGIAFSTIKDEQIEFKIKVAKKGRYYLAIRYTNASASAGLNLYSQDFSGSFKNSDSPYFKWKLIGPKQVNYEEENVKVTNLGGISVLNTVVLISEQQFNEINKKTNNLLNQIDAVYIGNENDYQKLNKYISNELITIPQHQIDPTSYQLEIPATVNWLVFTDHFDKGWQLDDTKSLPFYEMVNGFYSEKMKGDIKLKYTPQEELIYAEKVSALSFLAIVIILTILIRRKKITK